MKSFTILVSMLLAIQAAEGQRLYHKDLDTSAQDALKAVQKIDSKKLFDNMLANLSIQSKQDFETVFSGIRQESRDRIQTWKTWCDVGGEMARVMNRLGGPSPKPIDYQDTEKLNTTCKDLLKTNFLPDPNANSVITATWQQHIDDLKTAKAKIDDQIEDLKKTDPTVTDPKIVAILSQLGSDGVANAIQSIQSSSAGKGLSAALTPAANASAIAKRLAQAYKDYQTQQAAISTAHGQLRLLTAAMLQVSSAKLTAEADHLTRMIAIEARRATELNSAANAYDDFRKTMVCELRHDTDISLRGIDEALARLGGEVRSNGYNWSAEMLNELSGKEDPCATRSARRRLANLTRALYYAVIVEVRGQTPEYFADLRRAQEEQRYSIVISSLEAQSYETLLNTGVQRLALFHAGGVKPEQIAQLVYQAGQLAGVSVIAQKQ